MRNKRYIVYAFAVLAVFTLFFARDILVPQPVASQNAIESIIQRAESGDVDAKNQIGNAYKTGRGVPQNYQKAAKWYRKAAKQGLARAQNNLGLLYRKGQGVPQDYQQAMKWFESAVEQDYPEAMANIAQMYESGWGVDKNGKEALKWYQAAADEGFAFAQNHMGLAYRNGDLVPQDYKKAVDFFHAAAIQNDQYSEYAQANLAEMYIRGWGVAKNLLKGSEWYAKSAGAGFEKAQEYMQQAVFYCTVDFKINDAQAEWCLIAAFSGNRDVQYTIGTLYGSGSYVEQDFSKSAQWYLKAAKQGHQQAQALLAIAYDKGQGVPQSSQEAYAWLSVLALGNPENKVIVEMLKTKENILSDFKPKELKKAKELAEKYRREYATDEIKGKVK